MLDCGYCGAILKERDFGKIRTRTGKLYQNLIYDCPKCGNSGGYSKAAFVRCVLSVKCFFSCDVPSNLVEPHHIYGRNSDNDCRLCGSKERCEHITDLCSYHHKMITEMNTVEARRLGRQLSFI